MGAWSGKWRVKLWIRTNLGIEEIRRRAMAYFGHEATPNMSLVAREPDRLLFSDPHGDLTVHIAAGRPNTVSVITHRWHDQAQRFVRDMAEPIDGIIHYEGESTRPAEEVLQRARAYFGQGGEGLGLALSAEQPHSLEFSGGGGRVVVGVRGNSRSEVEVAAREWGYHAEQFVRQLAGEEQAQ